MKSNKKLIFTSIFVAILWSINGLSNAQSDGNEIEWVQAGNCWTASEGYLYCGHTHPMSQENSDPFLSFVCYNDYQAVLLNHDSINANSTIRSITFEFGNKNFTDIWMAADKQESFLSNRVDPSNQGFHNLLQALLNTNASELQFVISANDIGGQIELSGAEWRAVQTFYDLCQG